MTAATYVDRARHWARWLEEKEVASAGKLPAARRALERKMRLPSGALYSLRYRPPKRIAVDLYEALRTAVIAAGEREKELIEHEITLAMASGMDVDHPALAAAAASIRTPQND